MAWRSSMAVAAALIGGSMVPAVAQVPEAPVNANRVPAIVIGKGGIIAGTALGGAAGALQQKQANVFLGTGHIGAGTGGTGLGIGNATGGIVDAPRAGTGGINDTVAWGVNTGGIVGSGRGLDAATGGIQDQVSFGQDTGGISGSRIGSGVGGVGDLNSLGAGTGGIKENNAQRFPAAR